MMRIRGIDRVLRSVRTIEGAGVHLRRVFGYHQVPLFDPFLLLDDFHSEDPDEYMAGFPWHPHRGIETITYVLRGAIAHGDSLGNAGVISAGDVQWMTAGSGIIHQEMPEEPDDGVLWGFQLWSNLPASHKMMPPRYRDVKRSDIPEVSLHGGATVRIICGQVDGHTGPVEGIVTHPEYLDVTLPSGTHFGRMIPSDHTVFLYVLQGALHIATSAEPYSHALAGRTGLNRHEDPGIGPRSVVLFGEGNVVQAQAGENGTRFLLVSGRPIGEPVAWGGPIVMNSEHQLRTAFQEYRDGTFLK